MHYELIAGSEICTQAPQNTVRYHFTTSAIAASEAQVSSMIKQTSTAKCRSTSSAWRGAPPGCCSLVLPPKDNWDESKGFLVRRWKRIKR
jgi:hypothetical protein